MQKQAEKLKLQSLSKTTNADGTLQLCFAAIELQTRYLFQCQIPILKEVVLD